jgi:hypothetical protein
LHSQVRWDVMAVTLAIGSTQMRRFVTWTALIAIALSAAQMARAGDARPDGFAQQMFAGDPGKDKSYACFVRSYDPGHLVRHPLQKVKAMKLLVTGEVDPESHKFGYSFRIGVNFRKRAGNFDSSGDCGVGGITESPAHKTVIGCSVDCDGGGISVELTPDNKSTLVRLERIRIWQNNRPDDEGLDLSGGADDKVFRLDRARLDMCRSLITDRKELAAIRTLKK